MQFWFVKVSFSVYHQYFTKTCEQCGNKFMALGNLNKHRLLGHKGGWNVCDYDSKTFTGWVNLWRHIKRKKNNKKQK